MTASCIHGIPWESGCTLCGRNMKPVPAIGGNVTYTTLPVLTREDVDTIIRLLKDIEYHVRTKR